MKYIHGSAWRKEYFEDLGVDGRIMLKQILKRQDTRGWSGVISLRIRTSGGLL